MLAWSPLETWGSHEETGGPTRGRYWLGSLALIGSWTPPAALTPWWHKLCLSEEVSLLISCRPLDLGGNPAHNRPFWLYGTSDRKSLSGKADHAPSALHSPAVEAAVDDGVVHGGAHCQPQHGQVDLLDVLLLAQLLAEPRHDEVNMIGQPAEGKGQHYNDHHLHYLREGERKLV